MQSQRLRATLKQGDTGPEVKLVQEWLSLRGASLNITSHFGAPTEAAVLDFCALQTIEPAQPFVDAALFERLSSPMREALAPVPRSGDLRQTLLAITERHLAQSPREVGGANCGPWVRLYMKGREGAAEQWCAGFVSFCLERACEVMGQPMPFASTTRIDDLVVVASKRDIASVRPGDLFVVQGAKPRSWAQTGVVRTVDAQGFLSIEGNASPIDGPDGDRVMSRRRSFVGCEFFEMAP